MTVRSVLMALGVLLCLGMVPSVQGQTASGAANQTATPGTQTGVFPSRPIRLVVPATAGGGPDLVARLIGPRLTEALGQPVVIENRPGGNGTIAAESVVRAVADGHTLLIGMDSLIAINPWLYKKMPIDTLRDLVPVASLISNGMVLVVHPSLPVNNLAEFIDLARRSRPPLSYASGGNGSQHHLTMERLKVRAGITLVHVPYKGGAPATAATVAGEVAAMMSGTSTANQIRAGRLRAIAVTSPMRSAVLPEVPSIAETYPDFEMTEWYAVFAPFGTPEPVVERLRSEVIAAITHPQTRERLLAGGAPQPWITTREEFAAHIRTDYERYEKIVRDAGAQVD